MIAFVDKITRIYIYLNNIDDAYYIGKKKKRIGFKYLIIPVYEEFDAVFCYYEYLCKIEDFNKENRYIKDGEIYYNPHIRICLTDGSRRDVYFKNEDELNSYINELIKSNKHIEI